MSLPQKTTAEDITTVVAYLKNQVGWTPLGRLRTAVDARHANGVKIESMKFMGLIDRNGEDVKLTDAGREFAAASTDEGREPIVAERLRAIPLFAETVDWMHYPKHLQPTKTDIANYWHDKQSDKTGGVTGDALTDGAVFFLRATDMAGLGKFVAAGTGRDTHLKGDENALEAFATQRHGAGERHAAKEGQATGAGAKATNGREAAAIQPIKQIDNQGGGNISTDLNINVQIHVAADAKPEVIRDIFKNMRRYVLDQPDIKEDSK